MPKVPFWVFILIALVYFTAIRVDTMEVDASQYAEMSREMMKSGDYLHIYDRGMDYLDKPPFLFWVSAASMKVFGVNTFGYKLPSILFALLALFSTYRLGKLLYGEATGRMAALVLATCQGMFLMTNDVRCDTILMSCVITAIWLLQEWVVGRKLGYLLAGSVFVGLGMMTKGPIALMVPVFCFGSDWVLKRQWRNFLQPSFLLALVVIGLILLPMSIGLYQQFDLHPEKVMDGKHHVSGLRFFYWSQSFGRITGESPWKNNVDISFLLVNMLWSFLPWILLLLPALFINCMRLVRGRLRLQDHEEWLTTGGFLLAYLALGSSGYQLPHYIFVVYPLAAIITARLLYELIEDKKYKALYNIMRPLHVVVTAIILLVTLVLVSYVFPAGALVVAAWAVGFVCWLYLAFRKTLPAKLLWLPAAGMVLANIFLTNQGYYTLLGYQSGSTVGKYICAHAISPGDVTSYKMEESYLAVNFYARGRIRTTDTSLGLAGAKYVYTMAKGIADLVRNNYKFDTLTKGRSYKVSELTPEFLNPRTRDKATHNYYFLKLK